jgi:hypothetical protein
MSTAWSLPGHRVVPTATACLSCHQRRGIGAFGTSAAGLESPLEVRHANDAYVLLQDDAWRAIRLVNVGGAPTTTDADNSAI